MKYIFNILPFFIGLTISIVGIAQEKITLRTDRDTYIAGEKIWFTVDCIADNAKHSTLSRIAYVELLNNHNIPVVQLKAHLNQGQASSFFFVPDSISTGNYALRSYTKWMKNNTEQLYTYKTISIVNPFVISRFPKAEKIFPADTVFCYLQNNVTIQGIENTLLLRTLSEMGIPTAKSGRLITPNGTEIPFKTNNKGFAKLNIKPEKAGSFFISLEDKSEKWLAFESKQEGYKLKVNYAENNKLSIHVEGNQQTRDIKKGQLHLATANGKFLQKFDITLSENSVTKIDTKNLPRSILVAYLFDLQGNKIASRYFSAHSTSSDSFKINMESYSFSTRDLVNLEIEKPSDLKNVTISVSKSALYNNQHLIKSNYLNYTSNNNIASSLSNQIDLNDLLLCFTPPSQFRVKENGKYDLPETKGEIISGTLKHAKTHEPLSNITLSANFVSETPQLYLAETNNKGQFKFVVNEFGLRDLVIQPLNNIDLEYIIDIDPAYSTQYGFDFDKLAFSNQQIKTISKCITNMQIEAIFEDYSTTKPQLVNPTDESPFYGDVNFSVAIDKFIELPTLEEIFHEIVPRVIIRKENGEKRIFIIDDGNNVIDNNNSLFLVDGIPVYDHAEILKMKPKDIKRIDVLSNNFFRKEQNIGRILSIFTQETNLDGIAFNKKVFRQERKCYNNNYEFVAINHQTDSTSLARIPDYRNLLYWNSNVSFDKNNRSKISFYTSDEKTDYQITVEGINPAGVLVRQTRTIKVQ